jgi:hypothetical protein
MVSAMVVEPRTSTNSMVSTTSAPPGYLVFMESQLVQKRGFLGDGRDPPKVRASAPPMPLKGVLQDTQRGSAGSRP